MSKSFPGPVLTLMAGTHDTSQFSAYCRVIIACASSVPVKKRGPTAEAVKLLAERRGMIRACPNLIDEVAAALSS